MPVRRFQFHKRSQYFIRVHIKAARPKVGAIDCRCDKSDEDLSPSRVKKNDPLVCDIGSLFTDFKG
jgi:hypothetical protein